MRPCIYARFQHIQVHRISVISELSNFRCIFMSMKLKDGTTVQDQRLTRLVNFDIKSKSYPITEIIKQKTPRSYTWGCDQHLDQGRDGACVGFSMVHELIARPAKIINLDEKFAKEKVYWEAQKIDPWPGGSYPGATTFYEGTSILAGIKILKKLGYIDSYRWAFGLSDLVMAIGYAGPAVIGIPWYSGMFNVHSCGQLHIGGTVAGGHAVLVKGVNVKNKTFTLHNSWGTAWGNNGDALISWDEMARLLHEQGEAVIPVGRRRL